MCDDEEKEEERRALLDFFRTQINACAQIIVGIVVATMTTGIATSFLPENSPFKLPLFLAGAGFLLGWAFLQYLQLFWYARLWNASLIAPPVCFKQVYGKDPEALKKYGENEKELKGEETEISKLYLGAHELAIEARYQKVSRYNLEPVFIYFATHIKWKVVFCIITALYGLLPAIIELFKFQIEFFVLWAMQFESLIRWAIWTVIWMIIVVVLIIIAKFWKCCSPEQIRDRLRSQDMKELAGLK